MCGIWASKSDCICAERKRASYATQEERDRFHIVGQQEYRERIWGVVVVEHESTESVLTVY